MNISNKLPWRSNYKKDQDRNFIKALTKKDGNNIW